MYNLLTQPLIQTRPCGNLTLPGVLAALARDEVESFPAVRAHQRPAWHMFLVQLAALALHGAGRPDIPAKETDWQSALRGLTAEFPNDEPWRLAVEDWTKPAFLQPPVPDGAKLATEVTTPDALDLLITSRNHDLKQSLAVRAEPDDWVFALVSLQTGEGYGGAGNHGIARMNGGSSSRPLLGLAPRSGNTPRALDTRPGAHFCRDVRVLLATREDDLQRYGHLNFVSTGGLGLTWLSPWPEDRQLQLEALDIWFIDVCRRVRLRHNGGQLIGQKGISKATRINAKHLNGALGDPWAPVHKTDNKSFTLAGRDFDYKTLIDLLLSGNWELPRLAKPGSGENDSEQFVLIAEALSRGNSKTEGFKSRILPIGGKTARALSLGPQREKLNTLAHAQMGEIDTLGKSISAGLAVVAARGDWAARKKEHYAYGAGARARFERLADEIFFERLWARFEAQGVGEAAVKSERDLFVKTLFGKAQTVFEAALPAIPCASIFRPRAEARARSAFRGSIWKAFPELFSKQDIEDLADAN